MIEICLAISQSQNTDSSWAGWSGYCCLGCILGGGGVLRRNYCKSANDAVLQFYVILSLLIFFYFYFCFVLFL